jgi:hypothetical protein
MRFCQRRYLFCATKTPVVAQYLGLAVQRWGQFACVISIPNIGPPGTPQLILPLANMHLRQSTLKIHSQFGLYIGFGQYPTRF